MIIYEIWFVGYDCGWDLKTCRATTDHSFRLSGPPQTSLEGSTTEPSVCSGVCSLTDLSLLGNQRTKDPVLLLPRTLASFPLYLFMFYWWGGLLYVLPEATILLTVRQSIIHSVLKTPSNVLLTVGSSTAQHLNYKRWLEKHRKDISAVLLRTLGSILDFMCKKKLKTLPLKHLPVYRPNEQP